MDTVELEEPGPRWDLLSSACPTRTVLDRIADRWSMLVTLALEPESRLRFNQLRRAVEGVTQKMLTQTLRGMERDGLVLRTVTPTVPVTVEYELTDLGRSLAATVQVLRHWSYAHVESILEARAAYDEQTAAP